jgi:putative oxidoreductase
MDQFTLSQNALTLLGRVCIAALFVPSGWGKLGNFAGLVSNIASKGVPLPEACAVIAIAAELGLGLLLLLGWQTRWVALGLALFVIVITPIFHGYWAVPSAQVMAQSQNFFKNTAIVGGLLVFAAFGAGGWSWDAMRRRGDDLVAAAKPRAQQ